MQPDNDYGDLSAFRKFIEESLDLAGLGRDEPPPGAPDFSHYHAGLANHIAFRKDIGDAWNALHRVKPGATYWGDELTPLQLETRAVLQEMIFVAVQKRFPSTPTEADLRAMITYTMTLSWLILGALEGKYAPPDDDIEAAAPSDLDC